MINVTKTYLPPLEDYVFYLKKVWDKNQVTNNGPLVQELEEKLRAYFGVRHVFFTSNGTVAIQIAIKALGLTKEVITTPFSYVATTTSILWENCKPVFVDIDKTTCCIDHKLIEAKISKNTEAILATHVYGIPCAVKEIEAIARKHKLKVIYDAAHAFGTTYKDRPLAAYGDISTLSFHATKIFHTIEGGAIITDDDDLAKKILLLRAFGHIDDVHYSIGINGKNSELHAAMGLCLLNKVPDFIIERKKISLEYDNLLNSEKTERPQIPEETEYNYAYYPILLENELVLNKVVKALHNHDINPRRYFHPSLNNLPYFSGEKCPLSDNIASRVLCLPLYYDLPLPEIKRISDIINSTL